MKTHLNKIKIEKPALRKEVETMIVNNGPYNNMTTIHYKGPVPNEKIIESINSLIHSMNIKLFGSRYKEDETCLEGIVIVDWETNRAKKVDALDSNKKFSDDEWLSRYNKTQEEIDQMFDNMVKEYSKKMGPYMPDIHILFKENSVFKDKEFETLLYDMVKKINVEEGILTEKKIDLHPIYDVKETAENLTKPITKNYNKYSDIFEVINEDYINFMGYYGWHV